MEMTKRASLALLILATLAGGLDAANVFVMPGGTGQALSIVGSSTLGTPVTVPNLPGAFMALARPDGERFYILSRTEDNHSLVILDKNFNVLSKKGLGSDVTTAAITPDGTRLVVLASFLRIFDTATGDEVLTSTEYFPGASHEDMAISQDSKYAFILSSSARRVIGVSLANKTVAGSVELSAAGTYGGVSVGPDGLVYASYQNRVMVIDPVSITQYGAEFEITGIPSRLRFTSDGLRAVALNSQTVTGRSGWVFDLATRTAAGLDNVAEVLDDVVVIGNNRAIAKSAGGNLYDIALYPASIAAAAIAAGQSISNVTGIAASNELPNAKHLYVTTATTGASGSISHIDLTGTGLVEVDRAVLGENTGKVSYAGAASSGPAVSAITINNNQAVVIGGTLRPFLAQFLDVEGKPVADAAILWSTGAAEVLIGSSTNTTTKEGFVRAQVTPPSTAGLYTVLATAADGIKASFNFTVTTSSSGGDGGTGGTPGSGGGLSIYSGNGQLVPEYSSSVQELVVLFRDTDGKPASNQAVTYEVTSGPISLGGSDTYTCSGTTCTTDTNGRTGIKFTASSTSYSSWMKAIVTARTSGGASAIFYIVIYMRTDIMGNTAEQPRITLLRPGYGDTLTGGVGATIKDAVAAQVFAGSGPSVNQPIPNVGLSVSTGFEESEGPTARCQDNLLTDSTGLASCDITFGGQLGQAPLTVTVGANRSWPRRIEVTPGAAALIRLVQGNNQTGTPGQKLTLSPTIAVTDASGNLLAGQTVNWQIVQSNSMTLSNVKTVTDSTGRASCDVTLGQTAGIVTLKVTSGAATATFSFTVNLKIGSLVKTSGDLQSAEPTQPFAEKLGVRVLDEGGKGVSGVQVAFSVLSGYATISPAVVTTDVNGNASASATAGSLAGTIVIRAAIGTFSQTFTLTAKLPGPMVASTGFLNAASRQQGVTPGGLAIVTGSGFADGITGRVDATATQGVYPTQLSGIEIRFNGFAAPILWASNQSGVQEVCVQVPFEVTTGAATVTIRSTAGLSATVANVVVKALDPGMFETTSGTVTYLTATRPDGSYVSLSNPARRGERIRFFVTGAGQTSPMLSTNVPAVSGQSILNDVVTGLDNEGIPTVSAVALEGSIGMYAITVEIPESWPTGTRPLAFAVKSASGEWVFAKDSALPVQ